MNQTNKQSGVILILAILLIAAVLGVTASFGGLIIRQIQQSQLIDQSIQAYYLAEAGSERALYQSRHRQAVKFSDCGNITKPNPSSCDPNTGYCSGEAAAVSCISDDSGNLSGKKLWTVSVSNERETSVTLAAGQSIQIDLFSPFQTSAMQIFQSFSITSNNPNADKVYGELINVTSLVPGVDTDCALQQRVMKDFITLYENTPDSNSSQSGYLAALNAPQFISNCSYVLRISNTAGILPDTRVFTIRLYDTAQNVNPATDQIDIPSRLIIESKAVYGNSQQIVRVRAPMRAPLSGLYDFVLFSEQEIIK